MIQFEYDSAEIKSESNGILDDVVKVLADNPSVEKLDIVGYTSSEGSKSHNQELSTNRAASVMAYLVDHGIALEICPTSNVCTRSVSSLEEHPLPSLVAAGVPVTINSDDPPMFATDLTHEYVVAGDLLGLDESGLADLARAAVRHSFAEPYRKAEILAEIDHFAAHWGNSSRP
jgi:adenosine deaminase/aminodeoxyfutalosine deaminase